MGVDVEKHIQHQDGVVMHLPARSCPEHVARRHPEPPRAADDRKLPQRVDDVVAADDGEVAAVVRPCCKHHVHAEEDRRACMDAKA